MISRPNIAAPNMFRFQEKIPRWAQNPYFLISVGFVVWMLFFDLEDFGTQYRLWRKLNQLRAEKQYYHEQIIKLKQDHEGLTQDKALLEKLAREKYFMKKKTEDLYVIIDP
ncbi:MAG: septum formation initiator family protein [Bacteroidota bacterium]